TEIHTRANFQPSDKAIMMAAPSVVLVIKIVPSVTPLIPDKCFVSVERKDVSAPVLFSSLSKKVMSWRSIDRNALLLARQISLSELKANAIPWVEKLMN